MVDKKDTKPATVEELQQQLNTANKRIAELEGENKQREADEVIIKEKMSHGLSRAQAEAAIKHQRDHDAAKKKKWSKRQPKIVAIIKQQKDLGSARTEAGRLYTDLASAEFNAAAESVAGK